VKAGMGLGQRSIDEQVGLHSSAGRAPVDGRSLGRRQGGSKGLTAETSVWSRQPPVVWRAMPSRMEETT
jgi:hypothetical protein